VSNPFLGEIRMFGGNFNPRGWAFCQGQLLPIAQNDALYALLGTTFGGDGQVTFGLPDLQGRRPVSQGQGPGLSTYVVGQLAGVESVQLLAAQLPAHSHPVAAVSRAGDSNTPGNKLWAAWSDNQYATSGAPNAQLAGAVIGPSAGGGPLHNNLSPSLALNFIIALEGVFPSRN
jgi:microcystin-dependent protein